MLDEKSLKKIFADNLHKYVNASGKTREEICSELEIAYSTFSEWMNGRKYPRIDKIELLANYFDIMKSDLIEEQYIPKENDKEEEGKMFDDRLKNLRKARGMSQAKVAEDLGLPQKTYCNYERNEREPNSATLIQIAEYFDVSIDDLLGYTPKSSCISSEIGMTTGNRMDTVDKITELLRKNGYSQKELTDYLGIDKSTFSQWKKGESQSYQKYISEIAKFLGTTPAYLMGWNTVSPEQQLSEVYLNLALKAQSHNIAPINIEMAIAFIQWIREKYPESR